MTLGGASLRADLSYDQTAKITGGAMMGMMRFAGAFSKQAREPIASHVYLKGDRMASVTADTAQITDLANETITSIDFKKKTYSVVTFADMAKAMAALGQNLKDESKAEVNMKVDVKATGQTREISGFATREMLMSMEIETTDPKSGNKSTILTTSNMWIAKDVGGYEQVKAFYQRMAQKMNWVPGANLGPMAGGNASMMKGMAAAAKETAKLDGAPLLQVVRMSMKGMGGPDEAGSGQQAQPTEQRPAPEAKQQEEAPSIGSVLGGRLGRLGGFGRRKKPQQEEQQQPAQQPAQQQAPQQQQQAAGSAQGVLMETTIEMTGFSTAGVDSSRFDVPAGFKQVESEMLKRMNK
ncbi:MAG: hypothetical protein ABFD86_21895 [Bryobacteraceae bacterium]